MFILGIILCVISVFIIYKRLTFIVFGEKAKGTIIGYGNSVKGYKGVEVYPYKVKYKYDDKEYIAYSLENISVAYGNIANRNLKREVTIYFKKDNPELITIKELNGTLIIGIFLLILGVLGIIL